jgi:hypothetical protein
VTAWNNSSGFFMDIFVKVYETKILNGINLFRVNPEYIEVFTKLGIEQDNVFYQANPLIAGVHSELGSEIHFSYLEDSEEEGFYKMKSDDKFIIDTNVFSNKDAENYLDSLSVNISYVFDCIEDLNNWAKTNYPEQYFEDLPNKISILLKEYETERF